MSSPAPTVLVVDDEVDACRNLQDILTDFGYRTNVAFNADDALQSVQRQPYDVVLLDLKMPNVDGLTLYSQIRRCRENASAIVVTAFASAETRQQAQELGVKQVLSKPVDVPVLLGRISDLVGRTSQVTV